VLKNGRISKEERINLEIISKIFNRLWCNSCIIVATHNEWELNSEGVLDEDIEKREIERWIGNDKEIKDFVEKIGGPCPNCRTPVTSVYSSLYFML
jgi:hypothetical protein